MRHKLIALAAALIFGSGGWAMAQSTTPNTTNASPQTSPAAGRPGGPDATATRAGTSGLESGANSFTEGQARRRIEDHGYTSLGGLHKDQNSIWQAEAMKDGRRVRVGLDFRGNVLEENP